MSLLTNYAIPVIIVAYATVAYATIVFLEVFYAKIYENA